MIILFHYGEIGLKGGNRGFFEEYLANNIKSALQDARLFCVQREFGRILARSKVGELATIDTTLIREKLKKVFGIANFSFVWETEPEIGKICKVSYQSYKSYGTRKKTFGIETKRSDKNFPLTSQKVNEKIGDFIRRKTKMKVDLENPDITFFIEIAEKNAYIYFEKIRGPGGLPVGVSGKALALISSGIDSPVGAWYLMKRGCRVDFIHFHSYPQTNKASIDNTKEIIKILNEYQDGSTFYLAPFLDIQKEIIKKAPAPWRVVMYRYYMFKIAELIPNYKALITGESLGQVASQTLDNIRALNESVKLPIFRPLIGMDKEEIIRKAKEIGTYNISIKPYDDCCSFFVPKHPVTKANGNTILNIAQKIDKKIIDKTLDNIEIINF